MSNLPKKLLTNLNTLVDCDLTCLIKFEQNRIKLIDYYFKDNKSGDFPSMFDQIEIRDFSHFQNLILTKFNFSSHLVNHFEYDNCKYFLYSTSRTNNSFNEQFYKIHSEFAEVIEELTFYFEVNDNNLIAKQDYFPLFAEASGEFIFKLDQYGIFTFVNKYGVDQLKYNGDEILGNHFFEFITDEYKAKAVNAFQLILTNKSEISFTAEIIPKVGVEQLFEIKLIPVLINGTLNHLLGLGRNFSAQNNDKKRNEELLAKLKEANRINSIERDRAKQQISILSELNTLKNEFISNISHELRTPLASIIGFSETILDDKNLTVDRAKEFSDVILTESKRLAKLINDVLDFSELENEKQHLAKSSINIIDVIVNCIEKFNAECENKKITLTNKVPDSEIIVFADEDRLKKAFNYIISNAIKFTGENGRITVIAQEFLKEVEIVISDTGVGIPKQKLPLLFDKFSKVNRAGNNLPGAGFGLVTVKQIIDLHKGLIRVKSEVDRGTSFIIRLPKYSFN